MKTIEFDYESTIEYSPLKRKLKCVAELDNNDRVKEVKSYLTPPFEERVYTPNSNTEVLIKEKARSLAKGKAVSTPTPIKKDVWFAPIDTNKSYTVTIIDELQTAPIATLAIPELDLILRASKECNGKISAKVLQDNYKLRKSTSELQSIIEKTGMFTKKVSGRGFSFFLKPGL